MKITIVIKCFITFEPLILYINAESRHSLLLRDYVNIDWSDETNAFCPSEPIRNDCWRLAPPPVPRLVQTVTYPTNKHRFWSFEPSLSGFLWKS